MTRAAFDTMSLLELEQLHALSVSRAEDAEAEHNAAACLHHLRLACDLADEISERLDAARDAGSLRAWGDAQMTAGL